MALAWLIGSILLMMHTVGQGRKLARRLAERHPRAYETLGRPLPGILQSARGRRFARFVARREFATLDDPALAAEFEAYKNREARVVIGLLASMLLVFGLVMIVRFAV